MYYQCVCDYTHTLAHCCIVGLQISLFFRSIRTVLDTILEALRKRIPPPRPHFPEKTFVVVVVVLVVVVVVVVILIVEKYLLERGQCKGLPLHCAKKTLVFVVVVVVVVFVVVEVAWALNM